MLSFSEAWQGPNILQYVSFILSSILDRWKNRMIGTRNLIEYELGVVPLKALDCLGRLNSFAEKEQAH